jgi:hypothetical protein
MVAKEPSPAERLVGVFALQVACLREQGLRDRRPEESMSEAIVRARAAWQKVREEGRGAG